MHDDDVPVAYEKILASNARAARASAGLTQASVAKRMRQLGCRWHFQTVGNVERGDRPLSAYELVALAFVLDTTAEVLLVPRSDVPTVQFADQVIPSQRVDGIDDSIMWDGDDIKVTAPTRVYRPAEQRRQAMAAMEAALEQMRRADPSEGR